ncbi:MAG: ankyrin repeat domain-containing protein [Caldilineaceae bacterium]
MTKPLVPTQEQVKEFVIAAHSNLEKVKTFLVAEPALLNERFADFNETALEAAAHMGNRPIAEYLLEQGAPLTICAAAMLGRYDAVVHFLDDEPTQVTAEGAHGIPLFFHAALSGDTAITALLLARGGGAGLTTSLHAAVQFGHLAMTEWLLAHGAALDIKNFQGQTPLEVAVARGYPEVAALLHTPTAPE